MDNTYAIKRQITYLIVPFAYEDDYAELKNAIRNLDKWNDQKVSPIHLLKHIDNLINNDIESKNSIASLYSLKSTFRNKVGLPNNVKTLIKYKDNNEEFNFSIKDIMLYIFETQVAFIVLEIGYEDSADLYALTRYNYTLKKLHFTKNEMFFVKNKIQNEYQHIKMSELVMNLISELKVKTFFEGKGGFPGQAIVYNVTLIDQKPEKVTIESYLYWMRRSFREGYLPSLDENLENNDEILRPFENSYWGVSLEGICNLIHTTNNQKTDDFFSGNYFGNIKSTYFYTFMLALHQRYALLHLSILASQIKLTPNNDIDIINSLKEKIIMFNLRCSFRYVTNVTHQSKLYELIRNNLQIEGLMFELDNELSMLSSMLEIEYRNEAEKKKAETENKQNKFNTVIILATTAFVMVSTAADAWNVLNVLADDVLKNLFSLRVISYLIIILMIGFMGLLGLITFIKNGLWKDK